MQRHILVVGTMLTGSTLLRLILDAHPNIAIGEETGFMGALAATKAIPNWRYGRQWYGRLGWTEEELDSRLREFYSGMFDRFAAEQGKSRWGDKTPLHSWHIPAMAQVFPDAVFVGIVRHPGAVVSSLKRRFHYEVGEAAAYWHSTNVEVLRRGTVMGSDRFALVRYEDLVRHSEPTLHELMDWLNEPWSDNLLRHHAVQLAKGAPRLVDGSTSTRDPISTERAGRWADELSFEERSVVTSATGDLAGFLGYALDDPSEPHMIVPPNAEGRTRLLTADVLADRQRVHADTVSFEARPEPVITAEMSTADLVKRLRQAEASLARIRARPAVRASDSVRRAQRRFAELSVRHVVGVALRRLALIVPRR